MGEANSLLYEQAKKGKIPPRFLEEAGIPSDFIEVIAPQLHEQGKYLSTRLRSLQKQLASTRRNIDRLKEQITQQGGKIHAEIGKLNQLDENEETAKTVEIEIEEIKTELANLSKSKKDPPQ
jgi:chromosome segregation ATPase